jgi:hypothetical protein
LKAVYHILVSIADTISGFNTGFDTVNLHRPTSRATAIATTLRPAVYRRNFKLTAYFESSSSYLSFKRWNQVWSTRGQPGVKLQHPTLSGALGHTFAAHRPVK